MVMKNKAKWASKQTGIETGFELFIQKMVNRLIVGHIRYGKAMHGQDYFSKLKKELTKYIKTGNKEHLYNVANYAFLEYLYPQYIDTHEDNTVESATRRIK